MLITPQGWRDGSPSSNIGLPLIAQGFKLIKTNGLDTSQYREENAYYICKRENYVNMPMYQYPCFCERMSVGEDPVLTTYAKFIPFLLPC